MNTLYLPSLRSVFLAQLQSNILTQQFHERRQHKHLHWKVDGKTLERDIAELFTLGGVIWFYLILIKS